LERCGTLRPAGRKAQFVACVWCRDFAWHVGAFKALIAGVSGTTLWEGVRVWQILLLQRVEGNWTISPALANALRAGEPTEDLMDNLPTYDPEHLVLSVPGPLLSCCMRHATAELAEHIWATLLALELKESMPFDCIINPSAPPLAQVTMGDKAERWLDEQVLLCPPLEGCLDAVRAKAKVLVQQWTEAFVEHLTQLKENVLNPPPAPEPQPEPSAPRAEGDAKGVMSIHSVVVAKVLAGSLAEGMTPEAKEKAKKSRLRAALLRLHAPFTKARSKLVFVVKSHPLGGIAMSPLSDPFTRADRLLVQVRIPPISPAVESQRSVVGGWYYTPVRLQEGLSWSRSAAEDPLNLAFSSMGACSTASTPETPFHSCVYSTQLSVARRKVPSCPITRRARGGEQFNVFIVMLSMCVSFYYSKSVRCCEALVVHYACEETLLSGDMAIDCMGYETCQDLSEQKKMMPEELLSTPFVCGAFPQSTLMGRVMVIIAISLVLVPVQMCAPACKSCES
jgi:hypothetical protein